SCLDRDLAVPAINQHTKLHSPWAPVRKERIQRSSRRAPGVKDVVHQHNILVFDLEPDLLFLHYGLGSERGQVITIESDVQGADRNFGILNASDDLAQPLRDWNPAAPD